MKKCLLTGFPVMTQEDYERYYNLTKEEAENNFAKEKNKFGPRSNDFYKARDLLNGLNKINGSMLHPVIDALESLTVISTLNNRKGY